MSNISKVDTNFKVATKLSKSDIKFYDVKDKPFKIYGVFYENGKFRRLGEKLAKRVSDGVYVLHAHTAGGRVRFKTDSPYVAIHTKMGDIGKMPHFALTGSAGLDLCINDKGEEYFATFIPPFDIKDGFESVVELGEPKMREITVNFPLYSEVCELYIGVSNTATLLEPKDYAYEKPIVFYGSSITQGGCASRPANSYQAIISRRLNTNYINLGFSGSARAEDEIAEYIKGLDMSVFVYDYDHNAPTAEYLDKTHEKMFNTIRKANPNLPIIIMQRPKFYLNDDEKKRLEIITATYNNAKTKGDNNVYFISGRQLMELAQNDGTVDTCHPNDLGFASMAKAVGDVLEKILKA